MDFLVILFLFIFMFNIVIKKIKNKKIVKLLAVMTFIVFCFLIIIFSGIKKNRTYESVQDYFNSNYGSDVCVEAVVYGDNSCLAYYKTDLSKYSYCWFDKSSEGYRLLKTNDYSKVFDRFDSFGSLKVYQIKDTDDYYLIAAFDPNLRNFAFYSENDVEIKSDIVQINKTSFYCGFIDEFSENSYFVIDGKLVK